MFETANQQLAHARVNPSAACGVDYAPAGQTLHPLVHQPPWAHPWTTAPVYELDPATDKLAWFATVAPGFVNGVCPVFKTDMRHAPDMTRWRIDELRRAGVKGLPESGDPTAPVESPLTDAPLVPMHWHKIGPDGSPYDAVPDFFTALGVGDPPKDLLEGLAAGSVHIDALSQTTPKGKRLLRSCDVYIEQPRNAVETYYDELNPAIDSASRRITLGMTTPPAGAKLALRSVAQLPPPDDDFDLLSAMQGGGFGDEPWDGKLLATVYMVSPENAKFDSMPDGNWEPYVQHFAFWNFNWGQPSAPRQSDSSPLTFFMPGIGGAFVQPFVNSMLAQINDANDAAAVALAARSLEGRFWSV